MRVALSFPGCHRQGGVERVVLEIAKFLSQRGHELTLLANETNDEAAAVARVEHVPVARQPWFLRGYSYFQSSSRMLAAMQGRFDVVSTHGVVCPLDGVHLVHSVHRAWLERSRQLRGLWSVARWKQLLNPVHRPLLHLERRHFRDRRYRRVIALTEGVRDDLKRLYAVPEEDIDIVPNGFNPEEFNPARALAARGALRQSLGYGESDRVVVFVANEFQRKGFAPLLQAIAALGDPTVKLLAIGRLDAHEYAMDIGRLGLRDQVRFTGSVSNVGDYYGAGDLFALPTQYEAWGLVIVEALASGLPVVTSRLAGAALAVREGETGILLDDPQDTGELRAALATSLARPRMAREEIARSVRALQSGEVLARFEEVLMECAAARKPAPQSECAFP